MYDNFTIKRKIAYHFEIYFILYFLSKMKNSKKSLTELSLAASVEIVTNTKDIVGGVQIQEQKKKQSLQEEYNKSK